MNDFVAILVPALALALLHFLWQGLLIGVAAWLALAMLRNARPQLRYAVGCGALLACVLLPAWSVAQALVAGSATALGDPTMPMDAIATRLSADTGHALRFDFSPSFDALPWIVACWAAGAATLSLRMACGWCWVQQLRYAARIDRDGRWQACIDALAPRLGVRRQVALRLVDTGDSPVTAGWWRPVVLLPVAVAMRLPADLVEALLAHELAHVRRHDYLVNLVQCAAEALLFYHPVTWWLSRRIRAERELVADDLASEALGDRRRLALALSELDRHIGERSPAPHVHYAPAAHGGHLMSRIQQLVRPQRRAMGATTLLPLVGLALVGVAFYAQARMAPEIPAAAQTTPVAVMEVGDGDTYALVREGEDGYTMSGDTSDRTAIEAAQRAIDGDFLWFRRDGAAWVVRDAELVAQARAAWARTDGLTEQMHALEARMTPHAEQLQALGARMEAMVVPNAFDTPEVRAAEARMASLGERMGPLAAEQAALGMRMQSASTADRQRMAREAEALAVKQEALAEEMERYAETMERAAERMESAHAPIEALAREMEAASAPMEAVGEQMGALGDRIGEVSERADAQVRRLIDDAYRNGRAEAAPTRR